MSDLIQMKKKRGRKSKKELEQMNKLNNEISFEQTDAVVNEIKYKKRGRKPKGGKIIQQYLFSENNVPVKSNVILHLKCFLRDIQNNSMQNIENKYECINMDSSNKLLYNEFEQDEGSFEFQNYSETCVNNNNNNNNINTQLQKLQQKIKILESSLSSNTVAKKACCFYCTESFDNFTIYIPNYIMNNKYFVYGNFCSPECAAGFLDKEPIDSSVRHERYSLLNNMYGKIYNHTKPIKPAPDPRYALEKFLGNLTIKEYRSLHNNNLFYTLIDKPITRLLPELHEDNDDFIVNNQMKSSNTMKNTDYYFQSATKIQN